MTDTTTPPPTSTAPATKASGTRGRAKAAGKSVGDAAHTARESMEAGYRKARTSASKAYAGAKDSAEHAVDATKRRAQRAARKGAETLDAAPLAVLIGGLAAGAIAGGLLPRTDREAKALGAVGKRVTGTAAAAARAAKTAGQDQLAAAGITTDAAKSQLSTLVDALVKAFVEAGNAATAEVKRKP